MNTMTSEWYEIEGKMFWKLVIRLRQGLDLLPLLIWDWTLLCVTRKLVDAVSELSFRKLLPFKVDVILCSGVPQTLILESRQSFRNRPWWVGRNLQYHHVPHSQRRREVGKARGKNKEKRKVYLYCSITVEHTLVALILKWFGLCSVQYFFFLVQNYEPVIL